MNDSACLLDVDSLWGLSPASIEQHFAGLDGVFIFGLRVVDNLGKSGNDGFGMLGSEGFGDWCLAECAFGSAIAIA